MRIADESSISEMTIAEHGPFCFVSAMYILFEDLTSQWFGENCGATSSHLNCQSEMLSIDFIRLCSARSSSWSESQRTKLGLKNMSRARQHHPGSTCSGCGASPILGPRATPSRLEHWKGVGICVNPSGFRCPVCPYDLCQSPTVKRKSVFCSCRTYRLQ